MERQLYRSLRNQEYAHICLVVEGLRSEAEASSPWIPRRMDRKCGEPACGEAVRPLTAPCCLRSSRPTQSASQAPLRQSWSAAIAALSPPWLQDSPAAEIGVAWCSLVCGPSTVLIGDAANAVTPLLGQGKNPGRRIICAFFPASNRRENGIVSE